MSEHTEETKALYEDTNAQRWAREFISRFAHYAVGGPTIDEGLMIGWFANAIEAGRSAVLRAPSPVQPVAKDDIDFATNQLVEDLAHMKPASDDERARIRGAFELFARQHAHRAEESCDICHGTGQYYVGSSGSESDGNAPEFERCTECTPSPLQVEEGAQKCPGEHCPMCSGEACNLCGAGCWGRSAQRCEHDSAERHMIAGSREDNHKCDKSCDGSKASPRAKTSTSDGYLCAGECQNYLNLDAEFTRFQVQSKSEERAWLIEFIEARWGTGYFWIGVSEFNEWGTIDRAVRFAREVDANRVIESLKKRDSHTNGMHYEACEHSWLAGPREGYSNE